MATHLPLLLAGPILRHVTTETLTLWLVTSQACPIQLTLYIDGNEQHTAPSVTTIKLGRHCFVRLIQLTMALPARTPIGYQLTFGESSSANTLPPHINYEKQAHPVFCIPTQLNEIVHGSCRNPHHASRDSLPQLDNELAYRCQHQRPFPDVLLLTGDQIYADDVAAPMLDAIHQVIATLGLYDEVFESAPIDDSQGLYRHPFTHNQREKLLPQTRAQRTVLGMLSHRPIFSSIHQQNHLISLAEFVALYLLVWSPTLWKRIELSADKHPTAYQHQYKTQLHHLRGFIDGLAGTQRLMAHLPTYMMFDDHDITDDWNLTAQWEHDAATHPFSARIIGNGLWAYWLFQGWGNQPHAFSPTLLESIQQWSNTPSQSNHNAVINQLNKVSHWHYQLATTPKLIVLDTRTQRWWSERNPNRPSGLMDWGSLIDLHHQLSGEDAVVLVSPAPIFGVKLIEILQRMFTAVGKPLAVDAENWMAHSGSANTLLNIFKHPNTPRHFVILSGDVHYSFAYDIRIRFRKHSPQIWQITSSGIKNHFPPKFIAVLDYLNRWLFASDSLFNLFTRRRRMEIKSRIPSSHATKRLANTSGIGFVSLNTEGKPTHIRTLTGNGEWITFQQTAARKGAAIVKRQQQRKKNE